LIPTEHGVDGLGKLRAAGLVDTARVDPGVLKSVFDCHFASAPYLLKPRERSGLLQVRHVFEGDLIIAPRMREDSVFDFIGIMVELEGEAVAVDEPHDEKMPKAGGN